MRSMHFAIDTKRTSHADTDDRAIPCIHASLKLYSTLRALQADEDPNEDLVEIWKSSQPAVSQGLIELLKQSEGKSCSRKVTHAYAYGIQAWTTTIISLSRLSMSYFQGRLAQSPVLNWRTLKRYDGIIPQLCFLHADWLSEAFSAFGY